MTIVFDVERLSIQGIALTSGQQALLRDAIQQELTVLLRQKGSAEGLKGGLSSPSSVASATLRAADVSDAAKTGRQIAHALYESVAGSGKGIRASRRSGGRR